MIKKTIVETMELFENSIVNEEKFTTFPVDEGANCTCREVNGKIYKCVDCRKRFCEDCPSKPLISDQTINCLECILNETQFHTSTPIKKVVDKFQM